MARVSKEYLEARRRQILRAAQRCFTRDGFHAASMLDIVREAGLSAGAVYRYFPSKDELIAAVARESVASSTAEVAAVIDASMAADPPLPPGDLFEHILRAYERHREAYKLMLQVQNGAVHSPAIAQAYIAGEVKLHQIFTGVVERYQALGVIPREYDAKDIGAALAGLLHTHMARWRLLDKRHNAAYRRGTRALLAALTLSSAATGRSNPQVATSPPRTAPRDRATAGAAQSGGGRRR